jgi:hypothetical protein
MAADKKFIWKKTGLVFVVLLMAFLTAGFISVIPIAKVNASTMPDTALITISGKLLYEIKTDAATEHSEKELSGLTPQRLIKGLNHNDAIKAFWMNIYNACYQLLAETKKLRYPAIYTRKLILIAGVHFSLDDIEHGILRKFRWKYSKGYFPAFFPREIIKQPAVSKIDFRIHFALNCGAKGCPPISFYTYEQLNRQLEIATKSFLLSDTEVDEVKKEVHVTKLMDWFKGDFGGTEGIREILYQYLKISAQEYTLKYKPYNWNELLKNFITGLPQDL